MKTVKKTLDEYELAFYLIFPFYAAFVVLSWHGLPIYFGGLLGALVLNVVFFVWMAFLPFDKDEFIHSFEVMGEGGLWGFAFIGFAALALSSFVSAFLFFGYALVFGGLSCNGWACLETVYPFALAAAPVFAVIVLPRIAMTDYDKGTLSPFLRRFAIDFVYLLCVSFAVFYVKSAYRDEAGIFSQVFDAILQEGAVAALRDLPVVSYPSESWARPDTYNFLQTFWLPFFGLSFGYSLFCSTMRVLRDEKKQAKTSS